MEIIHKFCRRCGRQLINNHGELFCLIHGEESPEPTCEPIRARYINKKAKVADEVQAAF